MTIWPQTYMSNYKTKMNKVRLININIPLRDGQLDDVRVFSRDLRQTAYIIPYPRLLMEDRYK